MTKTRVALLSVGSNTVLIIGKVVAGLMSGSVSILSEAIHSSLDLVAAIIAFFAVRISEKGPDDTHPYGHGKFENISGVLEGLLILVAAFWILAEAVEKWFYPQLPQNLEVGIAVMFGSALVNWIVSKKLMSVAQEHDSVALEADALHLKTDVYTSLGVGLGLLLVYITHIAWLDILVAVCVALLILSEAFSLIKKAFLPLVDTSLSEKEVNKLDSIITKQCREYNTDFHDLKTRKSGSMTYIDFHLDVSGSKTVAEAHDICDKIEAAISQKFYRSTVQIHVEAFEK